MKDFTPFNEVMNKIASSFIDTQIDSLKTLFESEETKISDTFIFSAHEFAVEKQAQIKRWKKRDSCTNAFYYDEELPHRVLSKSNVSNSFSSANMNFSDAWMTIILILDYTIRERFEKWSVVFSSKYVKSYYRNKGRVAKTFSTIRNEWVYLIANNIY